MSNASLQTQFESNKISEALSLLGKADKTVREMRTLIIALEESMKLLPDYMTADKFKTTHHFSPGIYMRELFIPKDMIVTGRIHKYGHLNILSQGKITVWTEDGMKRLDASTTMLSKPGIKRVGYSHEDTVWITVHNNPGEERDLKKIEERLFADTFDDAYLSSARTFEDASHFLGFSLDEISSLSENESDQIDFPIWPSLIDIKQSPIHGLGVFAENNIEAGTVVAPSRINGKRTPLGRFCNHSGNPNVSMEMQKNGDVYLITNKKIESGQEMFNDYYLTFENTSKESKLCQH